MIEYHKINTVFKRDVMTKSKTLIEGEYSNSAFEYLAKNEWVFTEKIDGTNIRIMWDGAKVTFGGKTDNAQIPAQLVQKLIDTFPSEKLSSGFSSDPVCLYGEGYGAKIQKGGGNYIPDGCGFILFDAKCGKWWLDRNNVEDVAAKCEIPIVPIIGRGTLLDAIEMTRNGFQSQIGTCIAEGLVMRPRVELLDRGGNRVISKIKYKDFKRN